MSRERAREIEKKYRFSFKGLTNSIYSNQIGSSKKRQHPRPTYTLDELREWIKLQLNFRELFKEWKNSGYKRNSTPSIDRLNDGLGYSFDNIRLVTWLENHSKNVTERVKFGKNSPQSRAVIRTDIQNGIEIEYHSIGAAARALGKSNLAGNSIGNCLRGLSKTSYGFNWKYKQKLTE